MLIKKGYTWEDKVNYYDATLFKSLLNNLKTYAKALNSASYSVTKTLSDVYENIKYQHALWVSLTDLAPNTLTFNNLILEKNQIYNFLKHFDKKTLLESIEFRMLIKNGIIKTSNSKLYEDPLRLDWFNNLNPILTNQYISNPFDYLIISYKAIDILAQDIDTRTSLVNTNYQNTYYEDNITNGTLFNNISLDGNEIGFGKGNTISSTSGLSYLNWGGDNLTQTEGESVLISFKNISNDIKYLKDISIKLNSFISGNITDGRIQITLTTFKGGDMIPLNESFINVGGVLTNTITTNRQIYRGRINYTDSLATCNNNDQVGLNGCDLWSGSLNEEGDNVGSIIYNVLNSNCIITDELYTNLKPTLNENLNVLDFTKFSWDMGTSGYSPDTYQDMIINENFTEEDLISTFQHVDSFSQNNVFTSQKVWDKLLNNFYIVDLATTTNIPLYDINKNPIPYSLYFIDNTLVLSGHIILFKNQTDNSENGLYTYTNSNFVKIDNLKTEEEVYFFSAFIKLGDVNNNKEFFLDTDENGIYSTTNFNFIEGNNYVLRNRCSYRLLADHTITDSDYFTTYQPIVDNDYTYRYFNGTNSYYSVSEDNKKFQYYIDGILNKENDSKGDLIKRIETIGNDIYCIRNNSLVIFNDFTIVNNKDIFTTIKTFDFDIIDFQLNNTNDAYYLSLNKLYHVNNSTTTFDIKALEFRYINNYIFFVNENGIYINSSNINYPILEKSHLSNISIEYVNNTYILYYLENKYAKKIQIGDIELSSLLSWYSSNTYNIKDFSKILIGDWEINNNNLFLKNTLLTNTDINEFPKILNGDNRYYDSVDDYSNIDVKSLTGLNTSFTLEFTIKPTQLKSNQTVIYFGENNSLLNNNIIPPNNYFSFVVNSGDDYPAFIFSNNKKLYLKSTQKLVIDKETIVSMVWNYSTTKTFAILYFDGIQVGTLTDILGGSNIPMNLLDINIEKIYLGKTEDLSSPSFKGYLKEVRMWNTVLNSAQIQSRLNQNLTIDNDTLYSELLNYWKLNDLYDIQLNLGATKIDAKFFGGLSNDTILKQIYSPKEIQLSEKTLYIKDVLEIENYFYSLDSYDNTVFDNTYQIKNLYGTNMLYLSPLDYIVRKNITTIDVYGFVKNIEEGDIIDVEVFNYFENINNNGTGGYLSITSDPSESSFINDINMTPNIFNKLSVSTTAGLNVNFFEIVLQTFDSSTYFKDLKITIKRKNKLNLIYTIDIFEEKCIQLYITDKSILSTYLDVDNNYYILEDDKIKKFDIIFNTIDNTPNITDFCITGNDIFTYNNNIVYKNNVEFALVNNLKYLYCTDTFYWKDNNDKIYIYDFDNKLIGSYPMDSKISINGFIVVNNRVYNNGVDIDKDNKFYGFNLKDIFGIYELNNDNMIIGVRNINNILQLWKYNISSNIFTLFVNNQNSGDITSYIDDISFVDLTTYSITRSEYVDNFIILVIKNYMLIFNIENGNKINYNKLSQKILLSDNITNIRFEDNNRFTLLTNDNKISYISNIGNLDLWKDTLLYDKTNNGWIVGDSGVFFKDNSNTTSFLLEYNNLVFKDDYTSIDVIKVPITNDKGYNVIEWSNTAYIVGKSGKMISTTDGTNFNFIETGVYSDLNSVSFFNLTDGLICGDNNTILSTFKSGSSFKNLNINLNRDWKDILIYEENKAIVVGSSGTIIHLTRNGFEWVLDNILNNNYLYNLNVEIKSSDLENNIKLVLKKDNDTSIYKQTLNQIEYLGENKFLVVGDNNLIAHIELVFDINFVVPYINFIKSDVDGNWKDIKKYDDKVLNQKRAFIIGNNKVYSIQYDRFNLLDTINTESTVATLLNINNTNNLTTLSVYDNYLFAGGEKVENIRHELFNNNNNHYIDNENIINSWIHGSDGAIWNTLNGFKITLLNNNSETLFTEVNLNNNSIYHFKSDFSFTNNFIDTLSFNYFDSINNNTIDSQNYTTNNIDYYGTHSVSAKYLGIKAHSTSGISNMFDIGSISITNKIYIYNQEYSYSSLNESYDLSSNFKPRMLFMDYYLGRKINVLLEDGSFITTSGKIDKTLLHCYYFNNNEYIEFKDYGTVDNQNNFLAYQDYYFLNRRQLDMPNSWGKTQEPYQKYNKRLTSIDDYYNNSTWSGELTPFGTNGNAIGFEFINEPITDIQTYTIGQVKEDSLTTKLRIGFNGNDNSYYHEGSIETYVINSNIGLRYTLKISNYLSVVKDDLVVMSFSSIPAIVQSQFMSSGNKYIVIDVDFSIDLPNYSGTIQKVSLNILKNTNINDNVSLTVLSKTRNEILNIGDKLYLQLNTTNFNIFKKCEVVESTIPNNYELRFIFDEFEQTININFSKDSTIDDILLQLLDFNKSFVVNLINQLLDKRCLPQFTPQERIVEQQTYIFNTTKNLSSIVVNSDNTNIMYMSSINNLVFVIDSSLNSVIEIINTQSTGKNIAYNPFYKLLYVAGGDNTNNFVDIIDTTNNQVINILNLGYGTNKLLYNPVNNYTYVSTTDNKYVIINNQIIVNTLNINVYNHIFVPYNKFIYVVDGSTLSWYDGDILINNLLLTGTLNELLFDSIDNTLYISNESKIYMLNLVNNVLSFIDIPQGIKVSDKTPFVFIDYSDKRLLFISNNNVIQNKYITIIDRITKTIVNTIYTNIYVSGITNNISENKIYLSGDDGSILLMDYNEDIYNLQINQDVEDFVFDDCLGVNDLYYNNYNNRVYPLKTNTYSISNILSGIFVSESLDIQLDKLIVDTNVLIKDIQNNKLAFYEKLDDEFVYEANMFDKKLVFRNLNYFNGDLTNLKQIFDNHLLSTSYDLTINKENYIYINGVVNDYTKYYNLETYVDLGVYSGTNFNIITNEVKYDSSVIYGANYNLLSFLKNLNPIFNYNYSFNLYSNSYTYNQQILDNNNLYREFSIYKNKINIGQDLEMKFLAGTFIDIFNINMGIERIYIKDIIKEKYNNTSFKYVIITDKQLETNLNLSGQVFIRTRDLLGEISLDLEFTDNINFPISNNGSHGVILMNNTYFNNQVSSFQYTKILLNDDNIKNEVSSILHLDESGDFNLNVIDWKNDANFYYRPLELFEAGIDKVLKKSITIDSSNYRVYGNTLSLVNVDLNKYNYIITDGMTLKYVEENYYWLLNADIKNSIIGQDSNGLVWYQGDWIAGTWESGTWYSGTAYDIEWVKGNVYSNTLINNYNIYSTTNDGSQTSTIFYNCLWYSGNFNAGTWYNGTFYNGNFSGIWNNGTWLSGIFTGISFNGGNWLNGTWIKGNFSQSNTYSTWNNGLWLGGDFENGTWLNGVFNQTDSLKSRFGTKADLLNPAIWEYGWFKNGEFHSGLTLDDNGNTIASSNYKYSFWYNGVWEKGSFYGGQTEMMTWKNGIFYNGYWKTSLNIVDFNIRNIRTDNKVYIEVVFDKKHYYKYLTVNDGGITKTLDNYFMMIGEPLITQGLINSNLESLGYNTKPIRHDIVEIIDEKTVLISIDDISGNFPYDITNGTNGYLDNKLFTPGNYSIVLNNINYLKEINSKKLVYAEKELNIIDNINNKDYILDWGSSSSGNLLNNIPNIGENIYHKKSNKTFIASSSTIKVIENDIISNVNSLPLNNQYYIINNNDIITTLNKASGNKVEMVYINPYILSYSIFELGFNVSDSSSGMLVNFTNIDKPIANENKIYVTAQYNDTTGLKTALFLSNNNGYLSHIILNGSVQIIGFDKNNNKIIFKENNKITYCYSTNLSNRIELIDLHYVNIPLFTTYLENKKEFYIGINSALYLLDTNLKLVYYADGIIRDIIFSEYYNSYHISVQGLSDQAGVYVLTTAFEKIHNYPIHNALDLLVDGKYGDKIYVATTNKLYLIDKTECVNMCTDYASSKISIIQTRGFDFSKFQYIGIPRIASHFVNGNFKQGIFEYGLRTNGIFEGGIWLDGISENGSFSS